MWAFTADWPRLLCSYWEEKQLLWDFTLSPGSRGWEHCPPHHSVLPGVEQGWCRHCPTVGTHGWHPTSRVVAVLSWPSVSSQWETQLMSLPCQHMQRSGRGHGIRVWLSLLHLPPLSPWVNQMGLQQMGQQQCLKNKGSFIQIPAALLPNKNKGMSLPFSSFIAHLKKNKTQHWTATGFLFL